MMKGFTASNIVLCGLRTDELRMDSFTKANIKINANFYKKGFVRKTNSCASN